ncbi:MAG: hypothetical protein IJX80_01310 [Clostridia bacterium]|nr:hypothetical protein [Clostridia bacterium]
MKHNESVEMYLETILLFKNSEVHAVDVAAALGYSKASISRVMKLFSSKNHCKYRSGFPMIEMSKG